MLYCNMRCFAVCLLLFILLELIFLFSLMHIFLYLCYTILFLFDPFPFCCSFVSLVFIFLAWFIRLSSKLCTSGCIRMLLAYILLINTQKYKKDGILEIDNSNVEGGQAENGNRNKST